jgi:acyl-CoA synthetase (NDP forming)
MLGDTARAELRALLPSFAAVGNPVDLTPQVEPDRVAAAARVVFDAPEVAGVVAVNVGLDIPAFADGVVAAAAATGKPTVAFTADAPRITATFAANRIPVLPSPERAVRAWRALWRARPRAAVAPPRAVAVAPDLRAAIGAAQGTLSYALARRLLEAVGVRFCREAAATTVDEAVAAADRLGYPVVVKADAAGLVHKTEAGGVRADLGTPAAVREACDAIRARIAVERFVVQEHVGPGVEVLIGARRDATFGPVVAAGAGGVLTEVVRDVALRMAPVPPDEAREMLGEGARGRLLAGPRGMSRDEDGALVRAIAGVGDLMLAVPGIVEIDLNPMIVWRGSAVAVDAVVIVERGQR